MKTTLVYIFAFLLVFIAFPTGVLSDKGSVKYTKEFGTSCIAHIYKQDLVSLRCLEDSAKVELSESSGFFELSSTREPSFTRSHFIEPTEITEAHAKFMERVRYLVSECDMESICNILKDEMNFLICQNGLQAYVGRNYMMLFDILAKTSVSGNVIFCLGERHDLLFFDSASRPSYSKGLSEFENSPKLDTIDFIIFERK